jgi:hypothetical protein
LITETRCPSVSTDSTAAAWSAVSPASFGMMIWNFLGAAGQHVFEARQVGAECARRRRGSGAARYRRRPARRRVTLRPSARSRPRGACTASGASSQITGSDSECCARSARSWIEVPAAAGTMPVRGTTRPRMVPSRCLARYSGPPVLAPLLEGSRGVPSSFFSALVSFTWLPFSSTACRRISGGVAQARGHPSRRPRPPHVRCPEDGGKLRRHRMLRLDTWTAETGNEALSASCSRCSRFWIPACAF